MVKQLLSLLHIEVLPLPFLIGGIGGSALYATHSGQLKGFPPHLAKAYWGPDFDVDLVSLGYIQRCGGSYLGKGVSLQVFDTDGTLIDESVILDNNLFPVTSLASLDLHAFSSRKYTAEEIEHMNIAEELHIFYSHPSDDVLIDGINFGHVPTHITASAVRNNRLLRGQCPHCIAGKITNDAMPPSLHEPESVIAHTLSTDVHKLSVPSPGGNTHKSNVVEHKTGHLGVVPHKSKHIIDMVEPLKKYIAVQFNAHGHKADNLLTDAESIYKATKPSFGKFGVSMHMTPPNQHAQRVERYTRTADDRKRAVLSGLGFVLPAKYDIYLDTHIAKMMNDLPNSLTSPLTPTILVEGMRPLFHHQFPFLPFGATCMVQQYKDKISKQAQELDINAGSVPKAELGVCMGEDPSHRGSYIFLVANGEVVPRRVLHPVNVHPWDWKRKFSPTAELLVPRVPKYNFNIQQNSSQFVDPSSSVPLIAPLSVPDFPETSADDYLSDTFTFMQPTASPLPAVVPVSAVTDSVTEPLPAAVPFPHGVVPVGVNPPAADSVVPAAVILPSLMAPVTPVKVSKSLPAVVAPLSDSPVKITVLPETELRRSTRTRNLAVPGSHRSYLGGTISNNPLGSNDSLTIPTATVHDMTFDDAVSYLSTVTLSGPTALAYAAADNLRPHPPSKGIEHTFKKAMLPGFVVAQHVVEAAVCKHLDMLVHELSTFSLISDADITPDCVRVYAQLLIKIKADERVTARVAAGGNRQPLSSHGETFAPTASESSSNLLLAVYQALGKQCNIPVAIDTFDLSNAFQNTILDKVNFPQQILMLMPDNLPAKYASYSGQWVEVHKAINGLRQANELFDKEVRSQMAIAGFTATCDPCVYHKQDTLDANVKCSINMHVDDGLSVNTCPQFYQDAVQQLTMRWGQLTHQLGRKKLYNGKNIISHNNGAISLSMESYIQRAAKELGVAHLPPVSTPSLADFFNLSIDTTPTDKQLYARFNGCLTHVTTKGRFDVRKESQHLSKQMSSPTEVDMRKMIRVWQYLNCTATMGPVYDTDEGTQLVLHVDTAFGVHANGAGHTGAYMSIGRYNAPIWVMSKQQEDIALSPQATEYFGLSDPLQPVLWHRQLLLDLGFPQERTIVWEDNIPAINLAYSPQITRKSRYMFVRHHFVRSLVQSKIIKICHVDSDNQAADLLTHSPKPPKFKHHRYALFNLKSLPLFS